MIRSNRILLFVFAWMIFFSGTSDNSFLSFKKNFIKQYNSLNIPGIEYDYHDYFNSIPDENKLQEQLRFFKDQDALLKKIAVRNLDGKNKLDHDHISYEIQFNLERITLEQQWVKAGRKTPNDGLHELPGYREWYKLFIKRFTSTEKTPEEIFAYGEAEVKRVHAEISSIMKAAGYSDLATFYKHLQHDSFFITNKDALIAEFDRIDRTVREHLYTFTGTQTVQPVYAMEWPDASANTPPGSYLNRRYTAYGKDVFQFNFYTGRYNRRAAEWLYMHEAIPGHHLQFSVRQRDELQDLFIYPGNFEGWACYVEYYGKDIGLYKDPYSYLGKWEWDLIRSARLVLDAGIHYYGWDRKNALEYWKRTIPGQDDIAEREITRVTNWCGQALSYKIGAATIMEMRDHWTKQHPGDSISNFHRSFLQAGQMPLIVLIKNIS